MVRKSKKRNPFKHRKASIPIDYEEGQRVLKSEIVKALKKDKPLQERGGDATIKELLKDRALFVKKAIYMEGTGWKRYMLEGKTQRISWAEGPLNSKHFRTVIHVVLIPKKKKRKGKK